MIMNNNSIENKIAQAPIHFNLAKVVLYWGLTAIAVLGIASIAFTAVYSEAGEVITAIKDILSLLLPVIGAWVGTVLAYFFSKDNFEAASRSTQALFKEFKTSEEKLKTVIAEKVMIPIKNSENLVLANEGIENTIKLKADIIDGIMEKDKSFPKNRLPILDAKMKPKYLIHRSIIDKFIVKNVAENKAMANLTLQDMLDDKDFSKYLKESYGTIKPTASLADAKSLVDNIDVCLDVYVTEDGTSNSTVVGWITNVIVSKESMV